MKMNSFVRDWGISKTDLVVIVWGRRIRWNRKWNVGLQNLFDEKLQLQNFEVERAHRVGNKEKSKKKTIVAKFASFKDKHKILSETRKLKGTNININEDYSKETLEIKKEKWKTVKELTKSGTYAILDYDKIVTNRKYRKQ